jgi:hypothetical protein
MRERERRWQPAPLKPYYLARREKRAAAQAALRKDLAVLDIRHADLQKEATCRRREARRRTSESTDSEAERR